jgi:hypothetical protein
MTEEQKQAVLDVCTGKMDKAGFLAVYGLSEGDIPHEVSSLLARAMEEKNAELVEYALMIGSCFSFPDGIFDVVHQLLLEPWHTRHEDMVSMLQYHRNPSSVRVLREVISLKPHLEYLDYDDYGAFYKKCLWALQAIGTEDALAVIKDCAESEDAALREQAAYRLKRIHSENRPNQGVQGTPAGAGAPDA